MEQEMGRQPVRVACVGASVTFGRGLADRRKECYPAVLQALLDKEFGDGSALVKNFGYSGATISRTSNEPYWETPSFTSSNRFRPHVVLIMLGTNDAQFVNVSARVNLAGDLGDLIEHYQNVTVPCEAVSSEHSSVMVAQMPAAVPPVEEIDFRALAKEVRPVIEQVSSERSVQLVDFDTTISATRETFPDGLHPVAEVAAQIAQVAFQAIRPRLLLI